MTNIPPESDNFYRTIFESSRTATVVLEENNTILLANEKFEELTGFTREEIEGRKKWMEFVHQKDDLERMKEYHRVRRVFPLSAPHMYEFQLVDRKGKVKYVVAAVAMIADKKHSLVALLDISDRKRMAAALTESQRRLADIIDFLPDATYAIDLSGKVIAWNRAMEELSGVQSENILGKGDYEYAIPFYGVRRPTLIDLVFKHIEEVEKNYHIVKRQGNVLIAEAVVSLRGMTFALWGKAGPLCDSGGNIIGAVESFRDVTEHKKAEKFLQEANDKLEVRVQERTAELMGANKLLQEEIAERKRAETALMESERRLTDIIDFLPDPTYAIDLSGKVIVWNHAIEEMTGVKAEDMLGKGDHEYIIPFYGAPRPVLIDLVFECDQELARKYDFVKRYGDMLLAEAEVPVRGVPHFLWGKAGPLYDSHGNIVGAIESVRDITDRRRMEAALRESERRLADIIDFLPDATFAIDVSGKVIAWNRAMEEMSGVKAEDILGKGDYEYTIPFYGMRRPALIDLALKFTDEDQKKYSFIKKEGNVLLIEAHVFTNGSSRFILGKAVPLYDSKGNIAGAIESVRDITELKQAQIALQKAHDELEIRVSERTSELVQANKALQKEILERKRTETVLEESEKRYDQFFKTSRDCVFITLANGKFVDMNNSVVEVLGYSSREEMMQVNVKELYVHQKDRIEIANYIAESGYVQEYPVDFRRKDGSRICVLITAVSVYDENGKVIGFQGTLRDVSEQRRNEEELKKYREKLEIMVQERTSELENRTKNLQEINTALNVLLQKRGEDKKRLEENFVMNIGHLVLPFVEKIKKNKLDVQQRFYLELIEKNLGEIASPLLKNIEQFDLTPREIQIASLIKDGKATKEVARILGIGEGSIDTHRKSIRKKLGLDRSSNLQSRLRFLEKNP